MNVIDKERADYLLGQLFDTWKNFEPDDAGIIADHIGYLSSELAQMPHDELHTLIAERIGKEN